MTPQQQYQLDFAKEVCPEGYKIISQHSEWSPEAMNCVWSKINKGEDLEDFFKFLPHSGKDDSGLLGRFDKILAFSVVSEISGDRQNQLIANPAETCITYAELNPECSDLELVFNTLIHIFKIKPTTGRVKLSECISKNTLLSTSLMSEGITEAKVILDSLHQLDNSEYALSIIYSADDCNIRGNQLIYALEYCGGDYSLLYKKLGCRDSTMISYINQCIQLNCNFLADGYTLPKAVSDGASFTEGRGFDPPVNCKILKEDNFNKCIKPLELDYSLLSINKTTSLEMGMKILYSLGFEDVYNEEILDLNGKPYVSFLDDGACNNIILHSPSNGSLVVIDCATMGNILFGGMNIMIPIEEENYLDFFQLAEVNRVENNPKRVCVALLGGEDYIESYRTIVSQISPHNPISTTELGYNPHNGIQLPEKYKFRFTTNRDYRHRDVQVLCQVSNTDFRYSLEKMINILNFPNIYKTLPENKKFLYKPYIQDMYKQGMKYGYVGLDISMNSACIGIASCYLDIPSSEIDKYVEGLVSRCKEYTSSVSERMLAEIKRNKDNFYGNSKLVQHVIEEFDIPVKRSPLVNGDDRKKEKSLNSFYKQLQPISNMAIKCNMYGYARLLEHQGDIQLLGSNFSVIYNSHGAYCTGKATVIPSKYWSQTLKKTVSVLTKTYKQPIKEIRFPLKQRFTDIKISPHPEEKGSYLIELQ